MAKAARERWSELPVLFMSAILMEVSARKTSSGERWTLSPNPLCPGTSESNRGHDQSVPRLPNLLSFPRMQSG